MGNYKEDDDYKRFYELENILSEGNLPWSEMEVLEEEQKNIIMKRYINYVNKITELYNKFTEKYGYFVKWDSIRICCGITNDYERGEIIQNMYIYDHNLEYDDGRIGKPYIQFDFGNSLHEVTITFDKLFDLDIAEKHFLVVCRDHLEQYNNDVERLEDQLYKLREIKDNLERFVNYEKIPNINANEFRYEYK